MHSVDMAHVQAAGLSGLNRTVRAGKRSTRLAFFMAGFALACWAPLVPFVQSRLDLEPAVLGALLLCFGFGAMTGMPISGMLAARTGSRFVITCCAICLVLTLPLLAIVSSPWFLGFCLLVFGISIGGVDVAANIHGAEVQRVARVPLMSGFHSLYSIGGLAGSGGVTFGLFSGLGIPFVAMLAALVVLACLLCAFSGFFPIHARRGEAGKNRPLFVVPKGRVLVIGVVALMVFLAEGAILDWSAILMIQVKGIDSSMSGAGYTAFAFAMVVSRFAGDRLVSRFGRRMILTGGMLLSGIGMALVAFAHSFSGILAGMAITGLAAGNIVPVLFTLAAQQSAMPAPDAVSATGIMGYSGVLAGPAVIGYFAGIIGLDRTFYVIALLVAGTVPAIWAVLPTERSRVCGAEKL